ncbi:MAG: response regulator, partial [Nitrospirae bacterium]
MPKGKVLVVDDEEVVRLSCQRLLEPEGYEVFQAGSPSEAIQVVEENRIDVVVSDLKMPEMDGVELLKHIKEVSPLTEIIIMTGYATVASAVEAMKYGAFDYIEKPFRAEELKLIVQKALEHKKLREENLRLREAISGGY